MDSLKFVSLFFLFLIDEFVMTQLSTLPKMVPAGERCWDPFLKRFNVGTDRCENLLSNEECERLFSSDRGENERRISSGLPPNASNSCDAPDMQALALKCAKTCFICCERDEFKCKNPRSSALFECENRLDKCRNVFWLEIMAKKCPHTCALCNYFKPTNGECRDIDELCGHRDIASLCNEKVHRERMARLCPKTCNACS